MLTEGRLSKGSKTGILGGAALGKSILTLEIIQHIVKKLQGSCVFSGGASVSAREMSYILSLKNMGYLLRR